MIVAITSLKVLLVLEKSPCSVAQIIRIAELDPATATTTMKRLQAQGLVKYDVEWNITKEGQKELDRIMICLQKLIE